MHVTVFQNEGSLGIKEVLDAESALRAELEGSREFWSLNVKRCVLNARPRVEEGNYPAEALAVKSEQQRITKDMSPGVYGVTNDSLVDNLKAPDHRPFEIPHDESRLRLHNEYGDVRDVARDVVLERESDLAAKIPPAAVRPVGRGSRWSFRKLLRRHGIRLSKDPLRAVRENGLRG